MYRSGYGDVNCYNKQSPSLFGGSGLFVAHMTGNSSPGGSSSVVTQGPRLLPSNTHGFHSCHTLERNSVEEHMDGFTAKPISGTQYFCPHFIGENLII